MKKWGILLGSILIVSKRYEDIEEISVPLGKAECFTFTKKLEEAIND